MKTCPQCRANNQADAQFCNGCGQTLPKSPASTLEFNDLKQIYNWIANLHIIVKVGVPVFLLIFFSLTVVLALKTSQRWKLENELAAQKTPESTSTSAFQQPSPSVPEPPKAPTSAERLAKAKTLLTEHATNDERTQAKVLLIDIPKDAKEYKEARLLIANEDKRNAEINREANKAAREIIVEKLEQDLLKKGMDFYFTWEGANKDVLRIKYVLMTRPVVYALTDDTGFLENLRKVDVKKVIFTDGYNDSWTFDLTK